ncbi:MAG TPA: rRNA maturation RNase YbeY [Candidatus Omnitrophota bacterium]|nr:rRNA maturation RNase YbeY [Candidatus Omnitrophota bacterium]
MKFSVDLSAAKKTDEKFFPQFQKNAQAILKALKFESAGLSVILVRDKKMAALNQKLMKHKGTTDVLSFSYIEKKGRVRLSAKVLNSNPPLFLGEIIICLDVAERNAQEYGTSFEYESALYLCHGILHCLGYEDETKKGFNEMQSYQMKILNKIFKSSAVSCQSLVDS